MDRSSPTKTLPDPRESAPTVPRDVADHLVHGNFWDPFSVLGSHAVDAGGHPARALRAFLPEASRAWAVSDDGKSKVPYQRIHPDGLFELVLPGQSDPFPYKIEVEGNDGHTWDFDDPYRFGPVLTDYDLHLLGEGTH